MHRIIKKIIGFLVRWDNVNITAGPESLEDYFQKGSFLVQKAALNL